MVVGLPRDREHDLAALGVDIELDENARQRSGEIVVAERARRLFGPPRKPGRRP